MKRLLIGSAMLLALLTAMPALARRHQQPTAACAVTPDPVSNDVEGYYTVVGSGFEPYQVLTISVSGPGETRTFFAQADQTGNVTRSDWAPFLETDGTWFVQIMQAGDDRQAVLAACTFDVT